MTFRLQIFKMFFLLVGILVFEQNLDDGVDSEEVSVFQYILFGGMLGCCMFTWFGAASFQKKQRDRAFKEISMPAVEFDSTMTQFKISSAWTNSLNAAMTPNPVLSPNPATEVITVEVEAMKQR
eukprot:TRINITY_DN38615_c0_g1_i1.p1 TRINITY_DN38615_c0_g1~~TRINITY_DN38615_c0_g1_i1.p1  ORF type:complete len:124 (-),score=22.61 TRINITY_DN38615_c0_g1_i1:5-376(-)